MLSIIISNRPVRKFAIPFSLALGTVAFTSSAAQAQSFLGTTGGFQVVCTRDGGEIVVRDSSCAAGDPGLSIPTGFQVGNATFNDTTNATTFTGGTVQVNAPITITGPTALNGTTTFGLSATFNALADFNNGITSNTITNSGTVSTLTLSAGTIIGTSITASGSLLVSSSSTVDMGNNRIQFVAAGVAGTDAVNVAQLNAATSGITADLTALETTSATHTTQIANLGTTTATQATQIANLETTTATHTTQVAELQAAIVDLPYIDINSSAGPASASGTEAIAVGGDAVASGATSVAIGYQSQATGTNSIAIGNGAIATGSIAIGAGASAANGGSAYGDNSAATGLGSVALGDGATATADNSVALGSGSIANEANAVSVGAIGAERQIVNVAAGEVSASSTDAVNGSQLFATNQNVATNTAAITALEAGQVLMAADIDTLFDTQSSDRRDMKQGVAAAMAMANAPMPSGPGTVSYAVNGALFRGEKAVGGSLMYRLPGDTPVAINAGFSFAGNKNNGVRLGVAGEF